MGKGPATKENPFFTRKKKKKKNFPSVKYLAVLLAIAPKPFKVSNELLKILKLYGNFKLAVNSMCNNSIYKQRLK